MKTRTGTLLTITALTAGAVMVVMGGLQAGDKPAAKVAQYAAAPVGSDEIYPYRSKQFTSFVDESYRVRGKGKSSDFYSWFENAYKTGSYKFPGKQNLSLSALTKAENKELSKITDKAKKTQAEVTIAAWTHRMIKKTIPRFSLDRGFEFFNTVAYGERQCFLQSVLIAGLLQDMGMDAGVEMVFRNPEGALSNNGHAVVLLKLPDGRDVVVDASEQIPFPRHQGLFVKASDYVYVRPVYAPQSAKILYYNTETGQRKISTGKVRTMGMAFLRSQFDYYRGERAVGGIIAANKTKAGLAASERYLRRSVQSCPQNPLAVYMLARTYREEKSPAMARKYTSLASGLYSRFGWNPGDLNDFVAAVRAM